jgi:quinolinate synthase
VLTLPLHEPVSSHLHQQTPGAYTLCSVDSLVMAERACAMATAGCTAVCVLGVDFMSENVRAILDDAGHSSVAVYRMAARDIGCSLAEAAESPAYEDYLTGAAAQPRSLHVVYINTSLRTKARANAIVPTITCTSSNVVRIVLQSFAQVRSSLALEPTRLSCSCAGGAKLSGCYCRYRICTCGSVQIRTWDAT